MRRAAELVLGGALILAVAAVLAVSFLARKIA